MEISVHFIETEYFGLRKLQSWKLIRRLFENFPNSPLPYINDGLWSNNHGLNQHCAGGEGGVTISSDHGRLYLTKNKMAGFAN